MLGFNGMLVDVAFTLALPAFPLLLRLWRLMNLQDLLLVCTSPCFFTMQDSKDGWMNPPMKGFILIVFVETGIPRFSNGLRSWGPILFLFFLSEAPLIFVFRFTTSWSSNHCHTSQSQVFTWICIGAETEPLPIW